MAKKKLEFDFGFPVFSKDKRPIKFNHNKILVSDIWAFWNFIIKDYSKTEKKKNILLSLLEQSKSFYKAAEQAETKSKPLLYYYSFLNFAKLTIEIQTNFEKFQRFDHGINPIHTTNNYNFDTDKLEILKLNSNEEDPKKRSVCYEFMEIVESTIVHTFPPKLEINVKKLLKHCVGVHRTYTNVYGIEEVFSRLENLQLYKDGKKLIFEAELVGGINNKNLSKLKEMYPNLQENNEKVILTIQENMNSYSVSQKSIFNLSKTLRDNGIWFYIGKDGYKYYLSHSSENRYSPSFIIYVIMFYLGSITRYHPYLFDEIFSQSDQWLISEFLNNQPKQFLYLTTSKALGVELREPYSKF